MTYDSNTALALRASRGKKAQNDVLWDLGWKIKPMCREWSFETLLSCQLNAVNPTSSMVVDRRQMLSYCSLRQREELMLTCSLQCVVRSEEVPLSPKSPGLERL